MAGDDIADQLRHEEVRYARVKSLPVALNAPSALRQDPLQELGAVGELAADERGADRERAVSRHLAQRLRAPIEILGVGHARFGVAAGSAREYAVRAEMNEARGMLAAPAGELLREAGIQG